MSERTIIFDIDNFYHIYNRGNSKQIIFRSEGDQNRFMKLLYLCNTIENRRLDVIFMNNKNIYDVRTENPLVAIGAYCLMPNHFHIMLTPLIENGISIFMQKIGTAYSKYYNKKYDRTGTLFEGKFKATHLNTDNYLKYIFSYIHLNPVKLIQKDWKENGINNVNKTFKYLENYSASSFLDWKGNSRNENKIVNKEPFKDVASVSKELLDDLLHWLKYTE